LDDDLAIFSGEVWIGQKAQAKGLIDDIGHMIPVMKAVHGDKVKFRRFGPKKSLLSRFGARLMGDAIGTIEDRSAFARFGL
jgi:serine protease SohB